MYHALGYSSILAMQATMTFEHKDIQTGMATIKDALQTCQRCGSSMSSSSLKLTLLDTSDLFPSVCRFRKRNSMVGSISSLMSKQPSDSLKEGNRVIETLSASNMSECVCVEILLACVCVQRRCMRRSAMLNVCCRKPH